MLKRLEGSEGKVIKEIIYSQYGVEVYFTDGTKLTVGAWGFDAFDFGCEITLDDKLIQPMPKYHANEGVQHG